MALETMDLHEVRSAMEGILFAAGEPVNIDRICLALELDKPTRLCRSGARRGQLVHDGTFAGA